MSVLANFPLDKETFCCLRDKVTIYESNLGKKCEFCKNLNHKMD